MLALLLADLPRLPVERGNLPRTIHLIAAMAFERRPVEVVFVDLVAARLGLAKLANSSRLSPFLIKDGFAVNENPNRKTFDPRFKPALLVDLLLDLEHIQTVHIRVFMGIVAGDNAQHFQRYVVAFD